MATRRDIRWAIVLVLAAGPSGFAQGPPGPGIGMGGFGPMGGMGPGAQGNPLMLLTAPAVQEELKLTEAQKTRLLGLARAAGQKGRDLAQAMFLSAGGGDPRAALAAAADLRRENERAIAGVLDPEQRERLGQISLRAEGPLAVGRPDVAARLNLNDAQVSAVQGVMIEMAQGLRQMLMQARQQAAGQFDPSRVGQVRAMAAQIRDQAAQQIGRILDRKQKAAFNKMLGAPFDLSTIDPMRPGATPSDDAPAKGSDAKAAADPGKDAGTADAPGPMPPERPARKKGRSRP